MSSDEILLERPLLCVLGRWAKENVYKVRTVQIELGRLNSDKVVASLAACSTVRGGRIVFTIASFVIFVVVVILVIILVIILVVIPVFTLVFILVTTLVVNLVVILVAPLDFPDNRLYRTVERVYGRSYISMSIGVRIAKYLSVPCPAGCPVLALVCSRERCESCSTNKEISKSPKEKKKRLERKLTSINIGSFASTDARCAPLMGPWFNPALRPEALPYCHPSVRVCMN